MSIAIAYIPEGYTAEQKKVMIEGTKEACMEGFGVSKDHSFVFVQEIPAENMDCSTPGMKCLFVYTTYGKSIYGKEIISKGFDDACAKAFGDQKGRTIVIFKEHSDENAASNGHVRPFAPGYKEMKMKK